MADDAIVLALANPEPGVHPDEAREAGAAVLDDRVVPAAVAGER